ncbi:MAG: Ig-like domain-containing protein [Clostridiales bacterium]|nr:Ig-like domain-containing protein [Clostridiales bacterium]
MSVTDTKKYLQNAASFSSSGKTVVQNTPEEYSGRQRQYLSRRTQEFVEKRAFLSSDFVEAEIQGLTEDFYAWTTTRIRMSDISTLNQTAITSKKIDDYKEVLIPDLDIDYLPVGAKIKAMGSTWIAVNPSNISSVNATSIVARCNASFNYYDEYGNIQTEPLILEKTSMLGNRNESPLNLVLMTGYFSAVCQLNDVTSKLSENSRIILGKKAYSITGYTDFIQEFTGDYDSWHICAFTLRVEEPTELDDIPNRIADGKSQRFSARIENVSEITSLSVGETVQITPKFIVNGKVSELPLEWEFTSSAANVSITSEGLLTGLSEGTTTVTAALKQNPDIFTSFEINVSGTAENKIAFVGLTPHRIKQYSFAEYKAAYFENGEQTDKPIEWEMLGALADYKPVVSGNEVKIYCISASSTPLVLRAKYQGLITEISIDLDGY